MATLHLLNKPTLTHDASIDCLRCLQKGDALLLMEDGVYLTQQHGIRKRGTSVYALQHDLHLRGLSPQESSVQIVDDAELVTLCTQYDKTISWF